MLITPQQHRLTSAGAVEQAWLDQRGRQPGPFCAFVRSQRPVAGRDRLQLRSVQLPQRRAHGRDTTGASGTLDEDRPPRSVQSPISLALISWPPLVGASLCQVARAAFFLARGVVLWGRDRRVGAGPGVAWPKRRRSGGEAAALATEAFPARAPGP